jgi:lambda family phage minor tail protein L
MAIEAVQAVSFAFAPSALLSLYELDSRYISANGALYRWHAGVNGNYRPIIFNGLEYDAFPIEVTDMAIEGSGGLPRPKLKASNVEGFISQFLLTQDGLVGAKFIRRRVYARFIDNANWTLGNPYGTPDPTAAYEDEIFYVNRLIEENPENVQIELVTPFELDNVKLPNRLMLATICSFKYREAESCGYSGVPLSDRFGKLFTTAAPDGYGYTLTAKGAWSAATTYQVGDWVTITSQNDFTYGETLVYVCSMANTVGSSNNPQFNAERWIADACPRSILGCKTHYPTGALPFGGFPGMARAPYQN